ncbi:MAG TPA: carboxypeptidase regulatory-like domain-containing protein [Ignavibacteriaceae bacterium]
MSSKLRYSGKILFVLSLLLLSSCKEDTIEPELYGSISGIVMDQANSTAIEGASITTSPPTSSILAGQDGKFIIDNIPVGNYTITAEKSGYLKGSVSVSVRDNASTEAVIFLAKDDGTNKAPNPPVNPKPMNAAADQQVNLTLAWNASDPDVGDSLTFTVYLYKSGSPAGNIAASGISDTTIEVNDLEYNTTYFWQVIVKDSAGLTSNGETWSFTTMPFPDNPLVYARKIGSNYEIFSGDTASINEVQLTNLVTREWWPRFNSRRSKIAFTSDESVGADIYTMDTDGSNIFRVTTLPVAGYNNYGIGFCWSYDDGKFFYSNNDKLYSVYSNGSGRIEIATAPAGRNFREVEQSPTGDKLVVLTIGSKIYDSEIYLMNPDGSDMTLLVDNLPGITESPSFSIDGSKIMFTHDVSGYQSMDGRQLDSRIFIYSLNGSDSTDVSLFKPAGTNDTYPRFSPDGAKIVFNNAPNDGSKAPEIWIMDIDGNNRRLITENGIMPDWK